MDNQKYYCPNCGSPEFLVKFAINFNSLVNARTGEYREEELDSEVKEVICLGCHQRRVDLEQDDECFEAILDITSRGRINEDQTN